MRNRQSPWFQEEAALIWWMERNEFATPAVWLGGTALEDVTVWQPLRGFPGTVPQLPSHSQKWGTAFVTAAASREETLARLAAADSENLVLIARNDLGASRWLKHFEQADSKHKCRILTGPKAAFESEWGLEPRPHPDLHGWWTCPGIFGWDKIDAGSKLLVETLPEKLPGRGADFGSGYGYLSMQLKGYDELHMVEIDWRGVEAGRKNVPGARHHWLDLTQEAGPTKLDWVVLNPPFHQAGRHVPELGLQLVAAAMKSLKPGGTLWMVANQTLPYEAGLPGAEIAGKAHGFKVLKVRR